MSIGFSIFYRTLNENVNRLRWIWCRWKWPGNTSVLRTHTKRIFVPSEFLTQIKILLILLRLPSACGYRGQISSFWIIETVDAYKLRITGNLCSKWPVIARHALQQFPISRSGSSVPSNASPALLQSDVMGRDVFSRLHNGPYCRSGPDVLKARGTARAHTRLSMRRPLT